MAMVYKYSIHKIGGSSEKLDDKDYDTKEEAQAVFDKLSKKEQKEYQLVELGYQDGQ